MVTCHLKQIGKVKKLAKWGPHELTVNQKIVILKCLPLLFYVMTWTIFQLDYDVWWKVDFVWQPGMTSSVVGPRRSSKALPKAKLAPKRIMVTVWWSAALLIHYIFMNPGKTITSEKRSILRKLMRCTENCSACSRCWSREMAKFFFKTVPGCMSYNQSFKSWMNWAVKFCFICHSHLSDLSPTD